MPSKFGYVPAISIDLTLPDAEALAEQDPYQFQ